MQQSGGLGGGVGVVLAGDHMAMTRVAAVFSEVTGVEVTAPSMTPAAV
ncbi:MULTISPECIES: hypothetical protein [unclassified Streptomyces]|nr:MULTISPECIES: hypothetical protein [unclassified Streptomyces]MBD3007455.1 hypothetical protein [Streptomyces sp. 5-10]